ncbi:MAG: GNAT family N-acetyltransferase [Clostridiales bacterium]|nr:GNAT family N-acetyltransferase [Clostridiales bacterium]
MVKIRKVKKSDFYDVFNLYKELYLAECPFDDNLNINYYETKESKNKVLKSIKSRKKTFLVAEEKDKVIGFVDGYMLNYSQYIHKVAYLDHLCVNINYRKRGIGKLLINSFEEKMKEQGAKFIKLNAFSENHAAISLYKKEDFSQYSVYYLKTIVD